MAAVKTFSLERWITTQFMAKCYCVLIGAFLCCVISAAQTPEIRLKSQRANPVGPWVLSTAERNDFANSFWALVDSAEDNFRNDKGEQVEYDYGHGRRPVFASKIQLPKAHCVLSPYVLDQSGEKLSLHCVLNYEPNDRATSRRTLTALKQVVESTLGRNSYRASLNGYFTRYKLPELIELVPTGGDRRADRRRTAVTVTIYDAMFGLDVSLSIAPGHFP